MPLPDFGDTAVAEKPTSLPDFGPEPQDVPAGRKLYDPAEFAGLGAALQQGPFTALARPEEPVPYTPLGLTPTVPGAQPDVTGGGRIQPNLTQQMAPVSGVQQAYDPNLKFKGGKATRADLIEQGLGESLLNTFDFMLSPVGIGTFGMGALPKAVQTGIAAYYTYKLAKEMPELGEQIGTELGKKPEDRDPELLAKLWADAGTAGLFATAGGAHLVGKARGAFPGDLTRAPDVVRAGPLQLGAEPRPGTEIGITDKGPPTLLPFAPFPVTAPPAGEKDLLPRPDQIAPPQAQGTFGDQLRTPPGSPAPGPVLGPDLPVGYPQPIGPTDPGAPGPMGQPGLGPWSPPGSVPPMRPLQPSADVPMPRSGYPYLIGPSELTRPGVMGQGVSRIGEPPPPTAEGGIAEPPPEPPAPTAPAGETIELTPEAAKKIAEQEAAAQRALADPRMEVAKQKLLRKNEAIRRMLDDRARLADRLADRNLAVQENVPPQTLKEFIKSAEDEIDQNKARIKEITEQQQRITLRKASAEAARARQVLKESADPTKPPAAGEAGFITAQGSQYTIDAKGHTTRLKRSPGVGEGVVYETSPVVYMSEAAANAVKTAGQANPFVRVILADKQPDGTYLQIKPASGEDIRHLKNPHVLLVSNDTGKIIGGGKASHTPEVGKSPFEIFYKNAGTEKVYHFGHPITKMRERPSGAPKIPHREGMEKLPRDVRVLFERAEDFLSRGEIEDARSVINGIRDQAAKIAKDENIRPEMVRLLDNVNALLDQYDEDFVVSKQTKEGELPAASQRGKLPEEILHYYLNEGPGTFQRRAGIAYDEEGPQKLIARAHEITDRLALNFDLESGRKRDSVITYLKELPIEEQEKIAAAIRVSGFMRRTHINSATRAQLYDWMDETIGKERKNLTKEEMERITELRERLEVIPATPDVLKERPEPVTPEDHINNFLATENGMGRFEANGGRDPTAGGDDVKRYMVFEAERQLRLGLKNDPKDPTRWFDESKIPAGFIATILRETDAFKKTEMSDWQRKKIEDWIDHILTTPAKQKPTTKPSPGGITSRFSFGRGSREKGSVFPSGSEGQIARVHKGAPELPLGDHQRIRVMNTNGDVVPAIFSGYWETPRGPRPNIGYAKEGMWSHTPLRPGDRILDAIPTFEEWKAKKGPTDATQKGQQQKGGEPEHLGTEAQRLPAEAGGGDSAQREAEIQAQKADVKEELPPTGPGEVSQQPVPPAATAEGSAITGGAEPPPKSPAISEPTPEVGKKQTTGGLRVKIDPETLKRRGTAGAVFPKGSEGVKGKGKTPDVPPVPPTTLQSMVSQPARDLYGVSERLRDWRARMGFTKEIEPGMGMPWRQAVQRGRDLLSIDPLAADKAVRKFADSGGKEISSDMVSVVRAKAEKMFAEARKIELSRGINAPDYKPTYDAAVEWDHASKPMQTEWHKIGQTQQGATDIDTGTFTDLNRYFKEITFRPETGEWEELTPKDKVKVEKIAEQVRQARENEQESKDAVEDAIQKLDAAGETEEQKRLDKELYGTPGEGGKGGGGKPGEGKKDYGNVKREEFEKEEIARRKRIADETGITPRGIMNRARDLLELGGMDFDTVVTKIANEKGISYQQVMELITQPKSIQRTTMEMWHRISEARKLEQSAKRFMENRALPPWQRVALKIPRAFFVAKILGHGAVGMITHAGLNMFNPHTWFFRDEQGKLKGYWPSTLDQWRYLNKTSHMNAMNILMHDENYDIARRAGLANDPFHYFDDFQLQQFEDIKGLGRITKAAKAFTAMGQRGFDALKSFRQDRFNQIWKNIPDSDKFVKVQTKAGELTEPNMHMARMVADAVNKATGFSSAHLGDANSFANVILFAPRLEMSRWGWAVRDPLVALKYIDRYRRGVSTPAERQFIMHQIKEKASIAATYIGLLIANQALLSYFGSKQRVNAPGLDPNWNPRRGDFLEFKGLHAQVKIISPMIGMISMLAQLYHALRPGQRTTFERLDSRYETGWKDFGRYARGKASPVAQTVLDFATRTDFSQRPLPWAAEDATKSQRLRGIERYSYPEYFFEQIAPIPVEEGIREVFMKEGMSEQQVSAWLKALKAMGATTLALTGARVSTDVYEPKDRKTAGPYIPSRPIIPSRPYIPGRP